MIKYVKILTEFSNTKHEERGKMKYCAYKSSHDWRNKIKRKNIAIEGVEKNELVNVLDYQVIRLIENDLHLIQTNKPKEIDKIIVEGEIKSACEMCANRLEKLTSGCTYCQFSNNEIENKILEKNEVNMENLQLFFEKNGAEALKLAHLTGDPLWSEIDPNDISFSEKAIRENKERLSERAKLAAQTKKYKNEKCKKCAFGNSKGNCSFTNPAYCQSNELFQTIEQVKEKTLQKIDNKENLLLFSLICGDTIKYNRIRYRISCLLDETKGEYLLTRDYHPWDTKRISFEELKKCVPNMEEIVKNKKALKELTKKEIDELSTAIKLIRENWNNIYRIESWQKQNMFWVKPNIKKKRVDICIHQSKYTYEWSYKNTKELLETTRRITI
jgi:hypothetical protein